MMINIDADFSKAEIALNNVPKDIAKASYRAINDTASKVNTATSVQIRKHYAISAKEIKSNITIRRAGASRLMAKVEAKGPALNLMKFNMKRRKNGDIFVQVKKSSSGKKLSNSSFWVNVGNAGVYHRVGKSRLPIQQEYGPSVPQMMGNSSILSEIEVIASRTLEARLEHHVNRILGGGI